LIEFADNNPDGSLNRKENNKFNNLGNLVEKVIYNADGNLS